MLISCTIAGDVLMYMTKYVHDEHDVLTMSLTLMDMATYTFITCQHVNTGTMFFFFAVVCF